MYKEMQLALLTRSIMLACTGNVVFSELTVFLAHTFTILYLKKKQCFLCSTE
jgi:hypothetical protein